MTVFSHDIIPSYEDADRTIRHYTPGVQESIDEVPDRVDNTPPTVAELEALNRARAKTDPILSYDQQHERSDRFEIPGEWISPIARNRRKAAMMLPNSAMIDDLSQRIGKVMRFDRAPQEISDLAQEARLAVSAAREVHEAARHPDNRRFAISTAAKDGVVQAIAAATALVTSLEHAAADAADQWFDSLIANLDKQRADALKALRTAEKAYSAFRSTVGGAQALAFESERWDKSWHQSTHTEHHLNAPIAAMREAIRYLDGENDYDSGRFLTQDYGASIPPHTLARLKHGADVSSPGSFAQQVYHRAVSPLPNDTAAQEAIRDKRLILLTNSSPLTADLVGRSDESS